MIPRRTIEEIVVRYRLEPTIREVFVEGPFDRDIYGWMLDRLKLHNVKIYPISTVQVDDETLTKRGLTSGARQRVIAFAHEAVDRGVDPDTIACVVDSDLDYFLEQVDDCPLLVRTDGTCSEMLVWKHEVLERFCRIVLGCEDPKSAAATLLEETEPLVCEMFFLRVAIAKLSLNWELIDAENAFERKKALSFDEYCRRVANKNSGMKSLASLNDEIESLKASQPASLPATRRMHGHDLMGTVRKILQNMRFDHGCLKDSFDMARTLMASLEWDNVREDPVVLAFTRLG
ncbi:DUF4435 domain-containing protein [Burkholderia sp. Ac-20365]|uniref:DUF4435 domain-containing protein n=1 Tax=Burkholderia sp. Ac-20365 TaxID=2703897 RepID=UPI00197BF358|nr:DUF4435 domain-containing protein [Burkholderia sp. Ac-20365]MBN3763403.1 DUF4435 domain-containing protein [Burkholderia sp. Ac-20365]